MPFQAGEIVGGKYEIIKVIGVGNIGFVVAARRTELGDEVALKFLRSDYAANDDLVARFAREARISVSLRSEHVARVFDVGRLSNGTPFIVMERLEGRDLSRVVAEHGALPPALAIEYVLQTCEALATAHAKGVIHRDIKPENLFLTRTTHGTEIIKVVDFGISKLALTGSVIENAGPLVATMAALGSPLYMSPEQIRACPNLDTRADIWALGCVLYELLTGKAAFDAPSIMQICAMVLESNPAPIERVNPSLASELGLAVTRCLAKDPAARFQSVADLAIALRPFAPDHARILAQRCSYVLKGAVRARLDSVEPDMQPPNPTGSGGGLAVSIAPQASVVDVGPEVSFRPVLKWKRAAFAVVAVGILAGFIAVRRSSDTETSGTRETGSKRVLPPVATATVPSASPVVEDPMAPLAPAVIAPIPSASTERPRTDRSNGERPRFERPNVIRTSPAKSAPPKEKADVATPHHGTESEPDVGF